MNMPDLGDVVNENPVLISELEMLSRFCSYNGIWFDWRTKLHLMECLTAQRARSAKSARLLSPTPRL
jgi:hypothetical protein